MSRDPDPVSLPPPGRPDPLVVALRRLEPTPAELRRDRLMYSAGAESRTSVIRLWQLTAGFMAAVGFAAGLYSRSPSVVDRVVYIDRDSGPATPAALPPLEGGTTTPPVIQEPRPVAPSQPLPGSVAPETTPGANLAEYFQIRNDVLLGGLGGLPDPGPQPPLPSAHDPFIE
jgi:hypothetical protein